MGLLADLSQDVAKQSAVPVFPEPPTSAGLRITRFLDLPACVTTTKKIQRLGEMVEEQLREHFSAHAADIDEFDRERAYAMQNEVRTKGDIIRTGSLSVALNEVEPSSVLSVHIGTDDYITEKMAVPELWVRLGPGKYVFRNNRSSRGLFLQVAADDRAWVASTFDRLRDESKRSEPAWSWLRSRKAISLLFIFTYLMLLAILLAILLATSLDKDEVSNAFITGAFLAIWPAGGWVYVLRRWIFRPFEVVEEGASSSAKWIGVIVLQSVSFALALIPLVLQAF